MTRPEAGYGMSRRGASLAEVVVALVVLATGGLAAAGLMTHAVGSLSEARAGMERIRVAAEVHDSLAAAGEVGEGERVVAGEAIRWSPLTDEGMDGWARIVAPRAGDRPPDTLRVFLGGTAGGGDGG